MIIEISDVQFKAIENLMSDDHLAGGRLNPIEHAAYVMVVKEFLTSPKLSTSNVLIHNGELGAMHKLIDKQQAEIERWTEDLDTEKKINASLLVENRKLALELVDALRDAQDEDVIPIR